MVNKSFGNILIFSFCLYFYNAFSCTTMSPNGARLYNDRVNVWISSAGSCTDANINGDQIISLANEAVNKYWNRISGSRLKFVVAGYWERDTLRFETGELCVSGVNCNNTTVPITNEVIISCNDNTDNFTATTYAKTSIVVDGKFIKGANILLNNTAGSIFGDLTRQQKLWVIAHELGHAAGLGHSKNPANLMYFTLTPSRDSLGEEDYWGMNYLYPENHDGCGLIGSIKDNENNIDKGNRFYSWFANFLLGIFFIILIVVFKKRFFKTMEFVS